MGLDVLLPLHLPFNLSNQYTGAEEDKINKPDRPIPSGLVTVEGARFRWYIVTVLYLIVGLAIGNVWSSSSLDTGLFGLQSLWIE